MKCFVCNCEFNGNSCSRCGFPVVEIPGDYETGLKALEPTIKKYRSDFSQKIKLGVVIHDYEITDNVTYKGEKKLSLGTAASLAAKVSYLNENFTNIPSRSEIPVTLCVEIEGQKETRISVNVKNLSSETIQLGIYLDDKLNFCFILRDPSGNTVSSQMTPVIK